MSVFPRGSVESLRFTLFLATGLALPFYAFAPIHILSRHVDLATVLAGLFVLVSLVGRGRDILGRHGTFLLLAAVIPLLVLIPPRPPIFSIKDFGVSYGHWLLVVTFFGAALSLNLTDKRRFQLVLWNLALGVGVALFGLYQAVGKVRGWPGTGSMLLPFQRGPFRFMTIAGYERPTSIFLEPSWMGGYLAWVLALAIPLLWYGSLPRRRRLLVALAIPPMLLALLATVSWGAYLDLIVILGVLLLAYSRDRPRARRRLAFSFLACAALAAAFAIAPPGRRLAAAIGTRWRTLQELRNFSLDDPATYQDSSGMRLRNLVATADFVRARPIGGIGLGQFAKYAPRYDPERSNFDNPWCGWLAIAAQMGIVGPAVLLGAILLVFIRWKRIPNDRYERVAVPALLGLAVIQQLHTGSFIDLWWWYPLSTAAVLGGPVPGRQEGPREPRDEISWHAVKAISDRPEG